MIVCESLNYSGKKSKMKKNLVALLLLLCLSGAKAQIYTSHNLFNENLFLYNPAYAGSVPNMTGFIDYKHHLTAISDAPRTAVAGIHSPVFSRMGAGLLLKTERYGLLQSFQARADYAYRTNITKNHKIAFGINGGIMQRNLDTDAVQVIDDTDPTLSGDYFRKNIFFFGGGLDYRYKDYRFSASLPVLYRTGTTLFYNTLFHTDYTFTFGEEQAIGFQPGLTAFFSETELRGLQAHLKFLYKKNFWFRTTAKAGKSLVFAVGFAYGRTEINYAYETNNRLLSYIGGATHEIGLSYGLVNTKAPKPMPLDTALLPEEDELYSHRLKRLVETNAYGQYAKAGNYAFYNETLSLTDSAYSIPDEISEYPDIVELPKEQIIIPENIELEDTAAIVENTDNQQDTTAVLTDKNQPDSKQGNETELTKEEYEILERGVHFKHASAMLTKASREYLDQVAELMKKHPDLRVGIEGHTCDLGTKQINMQYSERRANAVWFYLKEKGINTDRISAKGFGDNKPLVPNTSEANRKKNRRVEFKIVK